MLDFLTNNWLGVSLVGGLAGALYWLYRLTKRVDTLREELRAARDRHFALMQRVHDDWMQARDFRNEETKSRMLANERLGTELWQALTDLGEKAHLVWTPPGVTRGHWKPMTPVVNTPECGGVRTRTKKGAK